MKLIVILFCLMCLGGCSDPSYELVKSGKVDRVEYLTGGFLSSGVTIIYFVDGSTLKLNDIYNLPSKNIDIYYATNYGYHRIRKSSDNR